MAKRVYRARDMKFYFAGAPDCESDYEPAIRLCGICGKEYDDHGLSIYLEGPSKRFDVDYVCGPCMTLPPKRIAEQARKRAAAIRGTLAPELGPWTTEKDRLEYNNGWAETLCHAADVFDTLKSIDAIEGGLFARKIGECYKQLNAPKRTRNAA